MYTVQKCTNIHSLSLFLYIYTPLSLSLFIYIPSKDPYAH